MGLGVRFVFIFLLSQASEANQKLSLGVMLGVYTAGVSTAIVSGILGLSH